MTKDSSRVFRPEESLADPLGSQSVSVDVDAAAWLHSLPVALEAGRVGIWEWDVGSGRLVWSPTLEHIFSIAPGTFGGHMDALVARIHELDRQTVQTAISRALQERAYFRCEHRIMCEGDAIRWVELRGKVLPEPADKPRVAGVCLEVTHQLTAREQLDAERLRLRKLVNERTEALRESLEQLNRAERLGATTTLAAEIAHETNNSLSNIMMTAEHALRCPDRSDVKEAFAIIREEAVRISRITRGMLDAVKHEFTPKTFVNLTRVVKRAVRLGMRYVDSRLVTCELQLGTGLPSVQINETGIEQVIVNLIKNSAEAAAGPVRVVIRTRRMDGGGGVEISVSDDGPGIAADRLESVFLPFYSTKSGQNSRGLGLSLSRRIIADHGGQIAVESTLGQGATFTGRLPAAQPSTEPASSADGDATGLAETP